MTPDRAHRDPWNWPLWLLWILFLIVGAAPQETFLLLREAGRVTTQDAAVNAVWPISLAWVLWIGITAYRACGRAGLPPDEAFARALQVGLVAVVAFLPLFRIVDLLRFQEVAVPSLRMLVLGVAIARGLAWLYLFVLVTRYCLTKGDAAIAGMCSVFPSSHRDHGSP